MLRILLGLALVSFAVVAVPSRTTAQAGGQIDPATMVSEQALRSWQVIDLQPPTGSTLPDWDVLVWDFAELNGVMYVGGRFQKVRQASGSTEFSQPFLAAFDVSTGQWISSFRPSIDDGVYALSPSPDGSRLLVGGEFTNVNGAPLTSGLAALDPFTGAPDPQWKASVLHDDGDVMVKDIRVVGDDVFIGGRFSHIESPGVEPVRRYSLARLDGSSGALDPWAVPVNGGRIMSIAATPDGQELYLGGFFSTVGQTPGTKWMAGIRVEDGSVIAMADPIPPDRNWYVFAVEADEDQIYAGFEGHRLYTWDRQTTNKINEYFSAGFGGDFQAILLAETSDQTPDGARAVRRTVLMAGGHHHGYQMRVGAGDTRRTQVLWLSAYDPVSGERVYDWIPRFGMRDGVFALAQDSEGKVWVGGDPTSAATVPVRGFAVLPLRSPDDPVNLARNKEATQSTTAESGLMFVGRTPEQRCDNARNDLVSPAGAAVDGKVAGGAGECSFSVTDAETEPWWQVDLGEVGEVDLVRVWNMYSSFEPQNLFDLWIAVSSDAAAIDSTDPLALADDPAVTLARIDGQVPWFSEVPIGVFGRYVRLFMNSDEPVKMRLPEVEVIDLSDVEPPPVGEVDKILVPRGSVWRYLDGGAVPAAGWNEPEFDDATWGQGPALVGFGDADITTEVTAGATTTYLRREFNVDDPATVVGLSLDLLADDGAVAYLNGVELHRLRMPAGAIGPDTTSSETVWGAAERAWTTVEVPSTALVVGSNVLALELHNNWSGGSDLAGDAALTATDDIVVQPPVDQLLIPLDGSWRYLDTGVYPGDGWNAATYDDAAWSAGVAQFGYGDGDEATLIAEGPVPDRHITTWFRTEFDLEDPADIGHIDLGIVRDDGAVIYLNGVEVVRTNIAAGPVGPADRASEYAWGPGEREPVRFVVGAENLVAGTNVVAVELHSANPNSSDTSFALELIGVAP